MLANNWEVMGILSLTATVTVVDKLLFKQKGNVVEDKAMNNPVAEIGCKHFPFHRFIDNETNAGARVVPEVYDFVEKGNQVVFILKFKFQGIMGIPFVFTG